MRSVLLAGVLLAAFSHTGCMTLSVYDLSVYPVESRVLFIQNFTNNTFAPDANVELTEAVRAEITRRGNFVIAKNRNEARLRLYGRIVMYRKEGRMFDNLRQSTRTELVVACRISVRGTGGEVFARETAASVEYSETQGYRETELRARGRLNRLLAREVASAVERWYLSTFPVPPSPATKPEAPESPPPAKTAKAPAR